MEAVMETRYIRKGRRTGNHAETLRQWGYEVTENDTTIEVLAAGVITDQVSVKDFPAIIKERKVLDYATPVKFSDGKVLSGIFAVSRLGPLSAIITKGSVNQPRPQAQLSEEVQAALAQIN